MSARNPLTDAPPYDVEEAIRSLGQNIRTARLRRNISLAEIAATIGVERHVVGDAERGKLSTSIAVYAGLLWALHLTNQLADVAAPDRDEEGKALSQGRERKHAYATKPAVKAT